jgi:hypothetical protein
MRAVMAERAAMSARVVAALVACAIAGLPAPASAVPLTVGEVANYAGADRQRMLENGAKSEGAPRARRSRRSSIASSRNIPS